MFVLGNKNIIEKSVIFIFLFFIFLTILGPKLLVADFDILWHIKLGENIIENKTLMFDKDIFAYTINEQNWDYVSWLYDVIMALIYRKFGFGGIIAFFSVIFSVLYILIYDFLKKKGLNLIFFVILSLLFFIRYEKSLEF